MQVMLCLKLRKNVDNEDENVHRFALRAIIGDLWREKEREKEREREGKKWTKIDLR